MRQMQSITFALLFIAILIFGFAQQTLTADFSSASHSFFDFFQTDQKRAQSIEAAELERQCSLDCSSQ